MAVGFAAIIAVVALVVLGPKELASSMRTLGQYASRARALAQEFRRGLDDLAREAEIDKVTDKLNEVRNFDLGRHIDAATDPTPGPTPPVADVGQKTADAPIADIAATIEEPKSKSESKP